VALPSKEESPDSTANGVLRKQEIAFLKASQLEQQ